MTNFRNVLVLVVSSVVFGDGCTDIGSVPPADEQYIRIYFKHDFRDEVDTFNGVLTKDLIMDGTRTVQFGFSSSEQDSLVKFLGQAQFFGLPDTLYPLPAVSIAPDPGPQILRVEYQGVRKSLVWQNVLDKSDPRTKTVQELWVSLERLVHSTESYKRLPAARGIYL